MPQPPHAPQSQIPSAPPPQPVQRTTPPPPPIPVPPPAAQAAAATAKEVDLGVPLRQLILAESEEACNTVSPEAQGELQLLLQGDLFQKKEFKDLVHGFMGRSVSSKLINEIALAVHEYMQKNDRLILHVNVPPQDASDGRLRLVIKLGRVNNISVRGNRWFSRELLLYKLGVKPGDEVRPSVLEQGINYANDNPYRLVRVQINDLRQGGQADLNIEVLEAAPWRVSASYDNAGSKVIGEDRFTGSGTYANLWGKDHQLTYQFTTSNLASVYQVHSVDYRAPLRPRESLQFNAAYALVTPTFGGGDFQQKGTNYYGLARYERSLPWHGFNLSYSGGLDFKSIDNNLEFGGTSVRSTAINIIQATFGGNAVYRDRLGGTMLGYNLSVSPGQLGQLNSDKNFRESRYGSDSSYVYASFTAQRMVMLPYKCQFLFTGAYQLSSTNLQSSEMMTIGGAGTVRGYTERIGSGDEGYVFNGELQGPNWQLWRMPFAKDKPKSELRLLAFTDYGHVWAKFPIGTDPTQYAMLSSGLGLRWNWAYYGSFSADYGWKLRPMKYSMDGLAGRLHLRASVSF